MNMEDVPIWMKRYIKRRMARDAERKVHIPTLPSSNSANQGCECRSTLPSNIVLFPGSLRLRIQQIR